MEDDLNKKKIEDDFKKNERWPKKIEDDLKKMEDNLKKKWKTTSKKIRKRIALWTTPPHPII
jgi:hypothetical protein